MTQRTIRLHTFFSVKGGVGKSTLATVCAKILAARGRVPVFVDCDLAGTCIADGLRLCAPKVTLHDDGAIDLEAEPTGELWSVEESRQLRNQRRAALQSDDKWKDRPRPPPFFTDPLNYVYLNKKPARTDALFWRHEQDDGVRYLPSSSTHEDVVQSLEWLYGNPFDWSRAFTATLDRLAHEMPSLTDVVVDLPTGIWGFPHETMVVVSKLLQHEPLPGDYPDWVGGPIRWLPNPFVVTSRDPSDFVPALEYIALHSNKLPTIKPIVNRANEGLDALRLVVRNRLGPIAESAGLDKMLDRVPVVDVFAKIFWDGDVDAATIPQDVVETLRLEEVPSEPQSRSSDLRERISS